MTLQYQELIVEYSRCYFIQMCRKGYDSYYIINTSICMALNVWHYKKKKKEGLVLSRVQIAEDR